MNAVEIEFLEDGGQPASEVAGRLVAFIQAAARSLDVAIYDFQAAGGATAAIADALEVAAARGVRVRLVFNVDQPRHPASPRPPICRPEEIDGLNVPTRGVSGNGALMHHKFIVRDGADVWTGSTNWTDDAFTREENVIVRLTSAAVAEVFRADFEQMWGSGNVDSSGGTGAEVDLAGTRVQAFLSPRGLSLAHAAASMIGEARQRIRILTPVLTSGPVLGTLAEFAARPSFDMAGAYDFTQMEEVAQQWSTVPANRWKIEAWQVVAPRLSGKRSTAFGRGTVHDYMHAKAIVADGAAVVGSYNFSRGGEENAENLLRIHGEDVSDRLASFAERVAARYAAAGVVK